MMTHSEFWLTLSRAFPEGRGEALAQDLVLLRLDRKTAVQALNGGTEPFEVWKAIVEEMDLPADEFLFLHRRRAEKKQ